MRNLKIFRNFVFGLILGFSIAGCSGGTTGDNGGGGGGGTFTVTYNVGTGNTVGTVPVDGNNYNSNESVTVLDNTGNLVGALIRDGIKQRFTKWNTQADGSGTDRLPWHIFAIIENTTLYAIYTTGTDVLRKVGPAGGWVFYDYRDRQKQHRFNSRKTKRSSRGF